MDDQVPSISVYTGGELKVKEFPSVGCGVVAVTVTAVVAAVLPRPFSTKPWMVNLYVLPGSKLSTKTVSVSAESTFTATTTLLESVTVYKKPFTSLDDDGSTIQPNVRQVVFAEPVTSHACIVNVLMLLPLLRIAYGGTAIVIVTNWSGQVLASDNADKPTRMSPPQGTFDINHVATSV